ncbi:hypothetical protein LSAT2_026226 [Lamellibrachia satsuma]|nr:hypothetical protein LSAT2_026226 [Lamellibrachia satsuma]
MEDMMNVKNYPYDYTDRYSHRKPITCGSDSVHRPDAVYCTDRNPSTESQQNCPRYDSGNIGTNSSLYTGEGKHMAPWFRQHMVKGNFCQEKGQTIDNSPTLLQKVSSLYDDRELSDIEIVVGSRVYYLQKMILCCSSDVFRVMLTNQSWVDCRKPRVALREEPACIHVFEYFLKYLYTGVVHLDHYNVLSILMLADKYNVRDLQEVCIDYMCSHIVSSTKHNHAISWLQYARLCRHPDLAEMCHRFILWNFHKVASSGEFLTMEHDLLIEFLQSSSLVVPNEYILYRFVSYWILHHKTKYSHQDRTYGTVALQLLCLVRFPMMSLHQLCQIEKDDLSLSFAEFFREQISSSMMYHSCVLDERKNRCEFPAQQHQPRNYTSEMWSTSLVVKDFPTMAQYDVRSLFLLSPISGSEADENKSWEWNIDLFPKGVQFQRCLMIGLWRNLEVSGTIYNTVRLSLECRVPERRHVDVSLLVTGVQDDVEYVHSVTERRCPFDDHMQVYNFNNIIPFDELNTPHSAYLSGPDANCFKITIIIKPVM